MRRGRNVALGVAFVVVCVTPYALVMGRLWGATGAANGRRVAANDIVISERTLEGLEWSAFAGEDIARVGSAFETQSKRLPDLAHVLRDGDRVTVERSLSRYQVAVREELKLLAAGKHVAAGEVHESEARPAFSEAVAVAVSISDREGAAFDGAERHSQVTALSLSVLSAVSLLGLLWVVSVMAKHRRSTAERARIDRRYQSLVDGSSDLFTVVSEEGRMTVLGSREGQPNALRATAAMERVSDLLPPPVLAQWSLLDADIRSGAGTRTFEFELTAPDGAVSYFEGHGSLLDDDTKERAWVWRDFTARKRLEMRLSHQALHDPLTGLANRALFRDRIAHALRQSLRTAQPTSVMFCDVDHFKTINDTLGHAGGDELLTLIAARLRDSVRTGDTVARVGGDEFAVILENADALVAGAMAERMMISVSAEAPIGGRRLCPTMSIGIATSAIGSLPEEVMRNADLAMYEAKRAGRARVEVFESAMLRVVAGRQDL